MRGIGRWCEASGAQDQQDQGHTRRNCAAYYRLIADYALTTNGNSGDQVGHYKIGTIRGEY